jgi:hypothetical protein
MNPISPEAVLNGDDDIFDMDFLISTSKETHDAIHFGNDYLIRKMPTERRPNDTIPWR